jgi:transposase InsO family protein
MFTDDYSRYTEVYFMKAKSEAPAKFKEYVAKVEKQHPKKKVFRIRVDGGGEYGSREKFLEYLAEEGIVREVSAPYSQQQNGLSERCNRSVMDPARSMLMHVGMPNKFWAEAVSTAVYIKNRLPTRTSPNLRLLSICLDPRRSTKEIR